MTLVYTTIAVGNTRNPEITNIILGPSEFHTKAEMSGPGVAAKPDMKL